MKHIHKFHSNPFMEDRYTCILTCIQAVMLTDKEPFWKGAGNER